MTRITIVIPVLNEAASITGTLAALAGFRRRGHQVVVVDGGSDDATIILSASMADEAIVAPRGRARQMNAGAAVAGGEVLLFLHADTRLPPDADSLVLSALHAGAKWGRFDVRIEGRSRMFPLIAAMMNRRSRLTGIATGDQAIFVRRDLFEAVGTFADQPLMEDIELCSRLRRISQPACLRQRVTTSGRRWDDRGVWRTILLMWRLRWRYWRGETPETLAMDYR